MLSIAPCRSEVSDRFPIASFDIEVPRQRFFEVACATDPRLFHTAWTRYRTPANFFTTRARGLLPAPEGRTAWFLPPEQLRRFAGARRIYYALGSYGNPQGAQPQFSIAPDALERVPSISLAADFTGRGLDRTRLFSYAQASDAYGSPAGTLRWGGDDYLESEQTVASPLSEEYDDGHSPELWRDEGAAPPAEQAAYDSGLAEQSALAFELGQDHEKGGECTDYQDSPPPVGGQQSWYGAPDDTYEQEDDGDETMERGLAADDGGRLSADEDEPAGYEDAAALYGAAGFEDAAALYGAVGYESDTGGDVAVEELPPDADTSAYGLEAVAGRDAAYSDDVVEEEELPAGPASHALATVALDIPEKVRVLRVVAKAESGGAGYSAINADSEYNDPNHPAYHRYHIGLSWGFIQFTQRSGALGRVLQAIKRREASLLPGLAAEHRFDQLFGPNADELLRVTADSDPEKRVAPVGGANLWEAAWTARFRAAGNVPHVTYAQNEIAITDYVDPNLRVASWLGFDSPRAVAMLVDRCIHMGNGGGLSWIMRVVGPVQSQSDRDKALRALGHADLRAFQSTYAPHLEADGRWGPRTHAAMTAALRNLGSRSPLPVADRDTMLQKLVNAAASTRFQRRLKALYDNRSDFSDAITFMLV